MTKNIDLVNIILICLSLALAYLIPFELFLFSYAFLGPLHYLTEINWLKEKRYFLPNPNYAVFFIVVAVAISIPGLLKVPIWPGVLKITFIDYLGNYLSNYSSALILFSFLISIAWVFFGDKDKRFYAILCFAFSIFLGLRFFPKGIFMMVIFVPTIIHVYIFTLLFMVFGALKTANISSKIAIVLLVSVPVIISFSPIDGSSYLLGQEAQDVFLASGFQGLGIKISEMMGITKDKDYMLYASNNVKIQIFIAFAYTYHYLNWFSKTSVIGWNRNMSVAKKSIILVIWAISILIYWYDYSLGMSLLFALSILHVLLEFPLNVTSIRAIGISLKRRENV